MTLVCCLICCSQLMWLMMMCDGEFVVVQLQSVHHNNLKTGPLLVPMLIMLSLTAATLSVILNSDMATRNCCPIIACLGLAFRWASFQLSVRKIIVLWPAEYMERNAEVRIMGILRISCMFLEFYGNSSVCELWDCLGNFHISM